MFKSLIKQRGFTLIELLVVVAIIGVLAAVGILAFNGFLLSAKKNVAEANFKTITSYLATERAVCATDPTGTVFGGVSCPITNSLPGAGSGWCGVFGDYFLNEANFENPFGGSAYGVGDSESDGITNCVLCNRSPYCNDSGTSGKYKLMWWYDGIMQDSFIFDPEG